MKSKLLEIANWKLCSIRRSAMKQLPILEFSVLVCLLLPPLIYGQTLKVDVNLVNVFATVKDDRGNFITDLSKEDFRVYDDDQLQDVRVFEKQDKVESSIGLLVDTSGSMIDIIPYVRRGVRDFTRALPKNDDFFLLSFGTTVKLLHTSKQPLKHLEEIRTELGRQYYIGYYVPRRVGFHHIRIEVPGRGVKIRAKTGYSGG